jgi:hypothetical protein
MINSTPNVIVLQHFSQALVVLFLKEPFKLEINIRKVLEDWRRDTHELKIGCQPTTNLIKDENGNRHKHSYIWNLWKNYFSQLL